MYDIYDLTSGGVFGCKDGKFGHVWCSIWAYFATILVTKVAESWDMMKSANPKPIHMEGEREPPPNVPLRRNSFLQKSPLILAIALIVYGILYWAFPEYWWLWVILAGIDVVGTSIWFLAESYKESQ